MMRKICWLGLLLSVQVLGTTPAKLNFDEESTIYPVGSSANATLLKWLKNPGGLERALNLYSEEHKDNVACVLFNWCVKQIEENFSVVCDSKFPSRDPSSVPLNTVQQSFDSILTCCRTLQTLLTRAKYEDDAATVESNAYCYAHLAALLGIADPVLCYLASNEVKAERNQTPLTFLTDDTQFFKTYKKTIEYYRNLAEQILQKLNDDHYDEKSPHWNELRLIVGQVLGDYGLSVNADDHAERFDLDPDELAGFIKNEFGSRPLFKPNTIDFRSPVPQTVDDVLGFFLSGPGVTIAPREGSRVGFHLVAGSEDDAKNFILDEIVSIFEFIVFPCSNCPPILKKATF